MFDQLRAAVMTSRSCPRTLKRKALRPAQPPDQELGQGRLDALPPDATATPLERAITVHVIQDGLQRACRDLGDQLQRLLVPLSKVPDPGVLVSASELERLIQGIRPPGAPRGPYAPQHL